MRMTISMFISPLLNNNVYSHEILWIYTTVGRLPIDTLKTTFWCVKILCTSIDFPPLFFFCFYYYTSFIYEPSIYSEKAQNALHLLVYLDWTSNTVRSIKSVLEERVTFFLPKCAVRINRKISLSLKIFGQWS